MRFDKILSIDTLFSFSKRGFGMQLYYGWEACLCFSTVSLSGRKKANIKRENQSPWNERRASYKKSSYIYQMRWIITPKRGGANNHRRRHAITNILAILNFTCGGSESSSGDTGRISGRHLPTRHVHTFLMQREHCIVSVMIIAKCESTRNKIIKTGCTHRRTNMKNRFKKGGKQCLMQQIRRVLIPESRRDATGEYVLRVFSERFVEVYESEEEEEGCSA